MPTLGSSLPPKEILTGVSFKRDAQVAGIAAVFRGGRVVSCDIVAAEDRLAAYLLAVLRQVEITANPKARGALICTDCELLLPCLSGKDAPLGKQAVDLVADLRGRLDLLDGKVSLECVPRTSTRTAYIAASQTRKAWEAGHEGERETWSAKPVNSLEAVA